MNRKKLNELKAQITEQRTKATDMDVLVSALLELPPGQLKKVLTEDVMAVLAKYGYTGE